MIISLNWLSQYIDLTDISTEEIVDKLTACGAEVEEVIDKSSEFKNIIVGYVESSDKHPNADRLSVCKVFDGSEHYNVVCGAPNVAAGQKVPFAKVGAIIPNGKFEIKKAKIRGEVSLGMICAEDELGLSDDHSGIMVLDDDAIVGDSLVKHLKMDDIIFDIAITPNRADALSHIGIARDLAAIFDRKIKYPTISTKYNLCKKNDDAEVVIENPEGCPRYSAVIIKNVEVKESPEWLKQRLTSIGLRPINNIVDVTNFVLHEVGQPLHAFDLNNVALHKIIVRNNNAEDKFVTLDSKEREMLPTDLMICDGEKPVAVAGVMGGENSEVTGSTKDILLESAYFNPAYVRKTAKNLGLSSDASYRFERGTNPNNTVNAALRAAELIVETAGGNIIEDIIDIYPSKIINNEVSVRYSRIEKILGFNIDKEKTLQILKGLDFSVIEEKDDFVKVSVPTFRHDIEREIDLIEEIVRIYGFDGIPNIDKISLALSPQTDQTSFEDLIKSKLVSFGSTEVISNSLLSDEKTIYYDKSIKVMNPQSIEMSRLRTSLIPGMLLNISRNLKAKENSLNFFEIGHVFRLKSENINSFDDFEEESHLLIALCGNKNFTEWYHKEDQYNFYDLSGLVENLFDSVLKLENLSDDYTEEDKYYYYKQIKSAQGKILGEGGKLKKDLLEKFDISEDVFLFEVNLDLLSGLKRDVNKFKPILKYPKVYRDFSFILDKKIKYKTVVNTINESSSKLLKKVNLFDIFESETLGTGKKSLAFQLEYYENDRTLRDEEIDKEFWKTIETVKTKLKANLRG